MLECSPGTEAEADCIVMELLTGGAACPSNSCLKARAHYPDYPINASLLCLSRLA